MKNNLLLAFLLSFILFGFSQNKTITYPNFVGQDFTSIQKNKDWIILDQVSGHLNDDSREDMALVLESKGYINEKRCNTCDFGENKARIVLVLLHGQGKQIVHSQNNDFIPRADEGRTKHDIYPIIIIENKEFIIYQEYLRAFYSYKFKLQNNKLNIVRARTTEHSVTIVESRKYDFTKGILTQKISPIASKEEKIEIIKFKTKPKTLTEFKQMHEWEVVKGFYL